MRSVLVAALVSCADGPRQSKARRFLTGLSADELQFIAEFMGASILEGEEPSPGSPSELAERVEGFRSARAGRATASEDQDLKAILLREFLRGTAIRKAPVAVRAAHA